MVPDAHAAVTPPRRLAAGFSGKDGALPDLDLENSGFIPSPGWRELEEHANRS